MVSIAREMALAILCLGGVIVGIYAYFTDDDDPGPVPYLRTTLAAATIAAEQSQQGKALLARLEQHQDGRWVYHVEIARGDRRIDVEVDPDSGIVTSVKQGRDVLQEN